MKNLVQDGKARYIIFLDEINLTKRDVIRDDESIDQSNYNWFKYDFIYQKKNYINCYYNFKNLLIFNNHKI